jgi:hypothetical protein
MSAPASPDRGLVSDAVMDGIRTHHMVRPHDAEALRLAERIHELTRRPTTPDDLTALHDAAAAVSPVTVADDLLRELQRRKSSRRRLRDLGRWLASHGTRRGAVAIGIVLLGSAGDHRDRDLLLRLGATEDLTLYAVVALRATQPDPEQAIFDLARQVTGWGRIHAVERLAGTTDEQIRAWLLREGWRNDVHNQYLAGIAATTGGLADALAADSIDEELLDGAGGILLAMADPGPARDLTGYPDGPMVIERYLHHAGRHRPGLRRIGVVARLLRLVDSPAAGSLPWAPRQRVRTQAQAAALTSRVEWRALVEDGLNSDDPDEFRRVLWPAEQLGIRFPDALVRQLRRDPYEISLWFSLVDEHDDIDLVIRVATELLPLAELAGPAPGGPALREAGDVLDVIVSRLDTHPGKGWPLVRTALRNAGVRNRNMALNVLEAWTAGAIPAEGWSIVRETIPGEPDPRVGSRLREVLAREPR